jgi:cellulose synthase/poly-beta-1,6-N-acetylglucosamine synthase-like glycosyltransferase
MHIVEVLVLPGDGRFDFSTDANVKLKKSIRLQEMLFIHHLRIINFSCTIFASEQALFLFFHIQVAFLFTRSKLQHLFPSFLYLTFRNMILYSLRIWPLFLYLPEVTNCVLHNCSQLILGLNGLYLVNIVLINDIGSSSVFTLRVRLTRRHKV